MERKRSRMDIIQDILETIQTKGGRIKPTRLMYKANLSYIQMNGYLDELMKQDLVNKIKEEKKDTNLIVITTKGYSFCNKLREMREFEKTFGL